MDWVNRLMQAMAYVEEHLEDDIDWEVAARLALCPSYQFARVFALITGIPLSEYVRRRRLTRAAFDLQEKRDKVLDVALRYGYASPTAFQRAFTLFHGVTPSQARRRGTSLQAYPPMSFQITIQGGIALKFRVEEKPAFRVVGYGEDISMLGGENFARIPQMWEELTEERCQTLMGLSDGKIDGMLGMIDMGPGANMLRYDICMSSEADPLPKGLRARDIGAATYAVFETSLQDIQDTTRRVFAEWLPNSGYEHAPAPEFEFYPNGEMGDKSKYMCEIWVPVVKG